MYEIAALILSFFPPPVHLSYGVRWYVSHQFTLRTIAADVSLYYETNDLLIGCESAVSHVHIDATVDGIMTLCHCSSSQVISSVYEVYSP